MPQRRALGGRDELPRLRHRAAVVALVTACIVSFCCLRFLGGSETEASGVPKLNLSGLYEDVPPQTRPPEPHGLGTDTHAAVGKDVRPAVGKDVRPAVGKDVRPAVGKDVHAVVGKSIPQTRAPALPGKTNEPTQPAKTVSKTDGATASPDGFAHCRAPVHGTVPSTACKQERMCTWETVSGKFLSGYAVDVDFRYKLDVAKQFCMDLGPLCFGISCDLHSQCSVRSGTELLLSAAGESTHVKRCSTAALDQSASGCDDSGQQVRPTLVDGASKRTDLHGAAVVVLAHNRKDDLRCCLESLLRLSDVGMFHLHVSLDDAAAELSMRATVEELSREHGTSISVWLQPPIKINPDKHSQEVQRWFDMNAGKIAHHYWMAFEKTFMEHKYEHAIFAEEDLIFSPDFLALFRSAAWLLDEDPSLGCISAWNDFGSATSVTDPCRLMRSSYFPGLGFLLQRSAWLRLREAWPTAPTMGWDYWMRVAFRNEGKECIIPEVSRSHHTSTTGSSVTKSSTLKLLSRMAFAHLPTSCNATGPCQHFGDLSYLVSSAYEEWMLGAITKATRIRKERLIATGEGPVPSLQPGTWYVLPFIREEMSVMAERLGMVAKGTRKAIPPDLRSEHYGIVVTTHVLTRARVILVDRRSRRGYLPDVAVQPHKQCVPVAGAQGDSCKTTCAKQGLQCDVQQMHFLNNCSSLQRHFACEEGCAHQVGQELPVYVPDSFQPTYRQCLVTFISPMLCEAKHPSTARLCACMPTA